MQLLPSSVFGIVVPVLGGRSDYLRVVATHPPAAGRVDPTVAADVVQRVLGTFGGRHGAISLLRRTRQPSELLRTLSADLLIRAEGPLLLTVRLFLVIIVGPR